MGGGVGEVVEIRQFAMGSPGKGKGEVMWGLRILQAGDHCGSTDRRGHGMDPPHIRLHPQEIGQKSGRGGGGTLPLLLFTSSSAASSEKGVGYTGGGGPWWHSCAFRGLLSSGLVRPILSWSRMFAEKTASGFGLLRGGPLAAAGADGPSAPGWFLGGRRFMTRLWRGSYKTRGSLGGWALAPAPEGGHCGGMGSRATGSLVLVV